MHVSRLYLCRAAAAVAAAAAASAIVAAVAQSIRKRVFRSSLFRHHVFVFFSHFFFLRQQTHTYYKHLVYCIVFSWGWSTVPTFFSGRSECALLYAAESIPESIKNAFVCSVSAASVKSCTASIPAGIY